MKFTMTRIAAAVALSAAAMTVHAVDFASMTVTGGTFSMAGAGGTFIAANLTPGLNLLAGNNQQINVSYNPGQLLNFGFFGPLSTFVGDGTYAPFGFGPAAGGGIAPTANGIFGGNITVDLSAWTAVWKANIPQGGIATGTVDLDGNYDIAWSSTVVGGAFDGMTGYWTMTGVVAVPEASTYTMMLAGLGLVGAMARRRKQAEA